MRCQKCGKTINSDDKGYCCACRFEMNRDEMAQVSMAFAVLFLVALVGLVTFLLWR